MSRSHRLAAYEQILAGSRVTEVLDAEMPRGGRPRQLGAKAVLLAVLVALDGGRPAHLRAAWRALSSLEAQDALRLGVATFTEEGYRLCTYRQLSHAFSVLVGPLDPSPVPSFTGVGEGDRASHLASSRAGVDGELRRELLYDVIDSLLEHSVPEAYREASSSLAIDWTDHESWSRPRTRDDPQPANDPDAGWGHAKRNAPGAKDCLFFGYYAGVATMVGDKRGDKVPELVRRVVLESARVDPATAMTSSLVRMSRSGVQLGDVLCDCGYSHREPARFSRPLRAAGARLVMDLHPNDRGQKGTYEGAVVANGGLYCPVTPPALLGLGPLRRGAPPDEAARHDALCEELHRYKFSPVTTRDASGYQRVCCPAAAGKVRCPLKASSMALDPDRPTVFEPPVATPERCCRQQTITVAPQVNEKTLQAYDYPSAAHARSYARRTAAERAYASLSDPSAGGIRRGWCRLFGHAKNSLMYALGVVVRNVRILESFERRLAAENKKASMPSPKRRRRRHQPSGDVHEAVDLRPGAPDTG